MVNYEYSGSLATVSPRRVNMRGERFSPLEPPYQTPLTLDFIQVHCAPSGMHKPGTVQTRHSHGRIAPVHKVV